MPTGQIIFMRPDGKSGYLRLPDTREEFFFRLEELPVITLRAGDAVTFQIQESKQGTVAVAVTKIGLA